MVLPPVTEEILKYIAHSPTRELVGGPNANAISHLSDRDRMRIAVYLAEKSYQQGGCPIGAD